MRFLRLRLKVDSENWFCDIISPKNNNQHSHTHTYNRQQIIIMIIQNKQLC